MELFRIRFLAATDHEAAIELIRELRGCPREDAETIIGARGVLLDEVRAAEARRIVERFAHVHAQVEVLRRDRYVYAFTPEHPGRGAQPVERLRVGERELGLAEGRLGSFTDETVEPHASAGANKRAGEARTQAWTAAGRTLAIREIEVLEAVSARDLALEASLRVRPDDRETHAIYGDWLQTHGDPRGQVIALQLALADASGDEAKRLADQDRALRGRHLGHLFGPLRRYADTIVDRWSLGFVDAATIADVRFHASATGPFEALAILLRLPIAARLQTLRLGNAAVQHPELVELLRASPVTAAIRELELGDEVMVAGPSLPELPRVWAALPRLNRVVIHDNDPPLGSLEAAQLVELELHLRGVWPRPIGGHRRTPARAPLPRLERLRIVIDEPARGVGGVEADFDPGVLERLLVRPELERATELCLRVHERLTTEIAAVLLASPRTPRFTRVDLSACRADNGVLRDLAHALASEILPADTRMPMPIV